MNILLFFEPIEFYQQELLLPELWDIWQGKNCTHQYHFLDFEGGYCSIYRPLRLISNEQSNCQRLLNSCLAFKDIEPKQQEIWERVSHLGQIVETKKDFEGTLALKKTSTRNK